MILEIVVILVNDLLAPRALLTFGTLQIAGEAHMHRVKRLRIGRNDLVAAFFALVSTHADFEL